MKSKLKSAFLILCAFGFLFTQSAAALSQTDLNALYGDWTAYVPDTGTGSCSGDGATGGGGNGAPDGATFPALDPSSMADAINTWISQSNSKSEMAGLGDTIVASAKQANISPFIIVSIARNESGMSDPGDFNVAHGNNSFGRSAAPGQPSFQGARAWYKWSSVKASVDYTAPENKGAVGGGDEAAYLRNQFGSYIDKNNLLAFMEAYGPKYDHNDPAGYVAKIKLWTSQLVALATGQVPPSDSSTTASSLITGSCSCSSAGGTDSKPTIVIDPGHSGLDKSVIDPATKLIDHDYPNVPEITEAFNIAQDLKTRLSNDGYNVVFTKQNIDDYVSLRQRADIANNAKADLAVSIHDDHNQNFGTFKQIYAQKVGDYRTNTVGQNITFDDQAVANKSAAYAAKFQAARQQTEGGSVNITNANFDNRKGLSPGNIPLVQLFSKVPWVYNEVGANGITQAQLKSYEDGIFKGIESSVPVSGASGSGVSANGCSSCTDSDSSVSGPNSAILCEAKKYNGIYYFSSGGHQSYSTFRQGCPEESLSSAGAASTGANPGPCATDCSGLVSVAVDAVYNLSTGWTVDEGNGTMIGGPDYWKEIPINSAQAGDLVSHPGHVEIVISVNNGAVSTFGSHQPGVRTGQVYSTTSYWTRAWRYNGPGAAN